MPMSHARLLSLAFLAFAMSQAAHAGASKATRIVRDVTPNAIAYVPASLRSPAPLIVLLHGAGGDARLFLDAFKRDADQRGFLLLSIQSSGRTWARRKPSGKEADVVNIETAMTALSSTMPVDRNRVTVMGFSDGASYALSVGMAYPDLFHTIVAFSPGYAFAPKELDTEQRIFITHSRRDPILPAENTRRMVEGLERAGFAPEVHWFSGGHEIDPQLKKAAFDFALAP
jgi:phospholipase/carboxylesterase